MKVTFGSAIWIKILSFVVLFAPILSIVNILKVDINMLNVVLIVFLLGLEIWLLLSVFLELKRKI